MNEKIILELGEVNNLIGRVLTIVDASYPDEQQRNGIKSLMKKEIWNWAKEPKVGITEKELYEISVEELPEEVQKELEDNKSIFEQYPNIPLED